MVQVTLEDTFNHEDEFSADQGLFFAFALDPLGGPQLPPEVGQFSVNVFEWGTERTGFASERIELPTHACSDEELGFKRTENSRPFQLADGHQAWINPNQKWTCIDK